MNNSNGNLIVAVLPLLGIFELSNHSNSITVTGGLDAPLLNMLSQSLKFTYTVKVPGDMEWGKKTQDGKWTGLIGMVYNGEADIAISRIGLTVQRMSVIHYSYPYYAEDVIFSKSFPDSLPTSTAFIRPFSKYVWLAILIYILSMPLIFRLLLSSKYSVGKLILKVFDSFFNHSSIMQGRCFRQQALLLLFYIVNFVITSCYVSLLLSFLTLPLKSENIRNIEELAIAIKAGNIKCSSIKGSFIADNLLKSQDESVKIIASNIQNTLLNVTGDEISNFVLNEKGCFVAPKDDIGHLIKEEAFVSQDNFFSLIPAIVVGKNFQWKEKLDTFVHRLWCSGLYFKGIQDTVHKIQKRSSRNSRDTASQLTISDLQGAFLVLIFGYFVSCIALIFEICFYSYPSKSYFSIETFQLCQHRISHLQNLL